MKLLILFQKKISHQFCLIISYILFFSFSQSTIFFHQRTCFLLPFFFLTFSGFEHERKCLNEKYENAETLLKVK